MISRFIHQRGTSTIEYATLILIVLGALFVMTPLMSRAFNGKWKTAGDTFGMGRQYQANRTNDCTYAQINADYGAWFDSTCYHQAIQSCKPETHPTPELLRRCEDDAKLGCSERYCCEDNDELAGQSNCLVHR